MKKSFTFLAFVIAFIIFSNSIISKSAYGMTDDVVTATRKEAICKAIEIVASDTDSYGFAGVDFYNLQVAEAIPVYEYRNGELFQIREYYPIIDRKHIVALAINVCDGKYAIETSLAKRIDQIGYSDVALIYDSQGVCICNGCDIALLGRSSVFVPGRDAIDLNSGNVMFSKISTQI